MGMLLAIYMTMFLGRVVKYHVIKVILQHTLATSLVKKTAIGHILQLYVHVSYQPLSALSVIY